MNDDQSDEDIKKAIILNGNWNLQIKKNPILMNHLNFMIWDKMPLSLGLKNKKVSSCHLPEFFDGGEFKKQKKN